jgi:di/tricarboxylate transporter
MLVISLLYLFQILVMSMRNIVKQNVKANNFKDVVKIFSCNIFMTFAEEFNSSLLLQLSKEHKRVDNRMTKMLNICLLCQVLQYLSLKYKNNLQFNYLLNRPHFCSVHKLNIVLPCTCTLP